MRAARSRLVAAWLAGLLALAGCATVPTSGPVENHSPQATGVNSGVRVDPLPPADGASQLLVVEGFLHAMGTYQPDYAVARQYLTESASRSWHPESGVQVYADGFPPTETETSVVLSVRLTGTMDAAGSYAPVSTEAPLLRQDFDLIKNEAGQWRINNPPEGLLVSRYAFTTGFVGVSLYFVDPDATVLVPDPRFFATGEQTLVETVRALLDGPSDWLAPAVRKTVTSGVTVSTVSVDSAGTAEVALGGAAVRLNDDQRRILLAELAYTLTGFSQVSGIRVTVGADTWRDDSGQAIIRPDTFSELSPVGSPAQRTLYLVKDRKLQRLSDPSAWDDFADVEVGFSRPEQIAVNPAQDEATATAADGSRLTSSKIGTDKATVLRTGESGLLRPDYARNGELWSPSASGPDGLQVFKGNQRLKVRIGTDPVPDVPVRALSVSPDGVRVAMVVSQGGLGIVGLARVERSEGQVTLSGWTVVDLQAITGNPGEAMDVGWSSATDLVVLQAGEDETSVLRVSQDGATSTDIGPSEALELTELAVAPQRVVVAMNPDGTVYRRDGEFNWNLAVAAA
ncbi:MAG: GerMN domain-containing protein, partial [Propionibacteriaceae bacterium]|nr:GerMN domain-containing protein [Propionibacteriaceae bacterium]